MQHDKCTGKLPRKCLLVMLGCGQGCKSMNATQRPAKPAYTTTYVRISYLARATPHPHEGAHHVGRDEDQTTHNNPCQMLSYCTSYSGSLRSYSTCITQAKPYSKHIRYIPSLTRRHKHEPLAKCRLQNPQLCSMTCFLCRPCCKLHPAAR